MKGLIHKNRIGLYCNKILTERKLFEVIVILNETITIGGAGETDGIRLRIIRKLEDV